MKVSEALTSLSPMRLRRRTPATAHSRLGDLHAGPDLRRRPASRLDSIAAVELPIFFLFFWRTFFPK